jgi:hypothetical protein
MVNFKLPRGPNSLSGVAAKPEEDAGTYVNKTAKAEAAGRGLYWFTLKLNLGTFGTHSWVKLGDVGHTDSSS